MNEPSNTPSTDVKNPFLHDATAPQYDDGGYQFQRFERLIFTGTAAAYFKIYFVNILLILVTLGIWVPWARVRQRRYFYSNTRILGDGLDYLATGFDLLKGWLLALAVIVTFYVIPFFPIEILFFQEALSFGLVLAYPWALNKSLQFNARNLVWRDVRFTWHGTYWGVFWSMFAAPLLGLLSLGIFMPMASRIMRHYIAEHYSFGSKQFEISSSIAEFYRVGGQTFLLLMAGGLLTLGPVFLVSFGALDFISRATGSIEIHNNPQVISMVSGIFLSLITVIVLFVVVTTYYRAGTRNLMINGLRLDKIILFRSEISGFKLALIVLQNMFVSVASLTLLLPWARVRYYRYLTENTFIRPNSDMAQFIDDERDAGHSVGDAISETAGLEISL